MDDLPWLDGVERIEQFGQEEAQHPDVVAIGDENNDSEPDSGEVLLVDEVAVHGHQDVEFGLRLSEQIAIQLAGLVHAGRSDSAAHATRALPA
jgi:hypothetical protein